MSATLQLLTSKKGQLEQELLHIEKQVHIWKLQNTSQAAPVGANAFPVRRLSHS